MAEDTTGSRFIRLFDLVVVVVLCTSVVSLALLTASAFDPQVALGSGFLLSLAVLLLLRRRQYRFRLKVDASSLTLVVALLATALLRLDTYPWTGGGQDQGVYVNMAAYFQQHGRIMPVDHIRESLPDDMKPLYDLSNYEKSGPPNWLENRQEGNYLPGVFVADGERSQLVFQFYHLHPLWMSIFGERLGSENRGYSLLLFALLSVAAFFFLALELTGSRRAALVCGGLLALNPLHAFFTRFPVTEIMALAFSSLALLYLLRYYRHSRNREFNPAWLVVSAVALGCLFFTRISGFMYMPILFLLLIVIELYVSDRRLRFQMRIYVFAVMALYALSVVYGLAYSYPYATSIYEKSFSRALGSQWRDILPLAAGAGLLGYGLALILRERYPGSPLSEFVSGARCYLVILFPLALVPGIYKVYHRGFVETGGDRWGISGTGMEVMLHWSPVVLIQHLSPFLLLLFGYVLWKSRRRMSPELTLLLVLVLMFWTYISYLQWIVPYQYYYARYLLSEALPYTLLFTVAAVFQVPVHRKLAFGLLAAAALYMLAVTATQLRGKDLGGYESSVASLFEHVDREEPLLVGQRWLWSVFNAELKTTLVYQHGVRVVSTNGENVEAFIDHYCRPPATRVHYLSAGPQPGLGRPVAWWDISATALKRDIILPTAFETRSASYPLYRIHCRSWNRRG